MGLKNGEEEVEGGMDAERCREDGSPRIEEGELVYVEPGVYLDGEMHARLKVVDWGAAVERAEERWKESRLLSDNVSDAGSWIIEDYQPEYDGWEVV